MNWNRCSRVGLALALLAVVAVGSTAAVETAPEGVPDASAVGSDVTATVTLTDLYAEYNAWTLHGETALTDVTWTVVAFNAADEQIDQQSYDGQSFNHSVDIENDAIRLEVRVAGTTPAVENYTYAPPQSYTLARFQRVRQGGTSEGIDAYSVHHYTEDSKAARTAIAEAEAAVEGSGSAAARDQLSKAIRAYDDGNFALAQELAGDAADEAEQARQSRQTTQTLLFGGLALVVLVVVAAGAYYWWSRRDEYDPLR